MTTFYTHTHQAVYSSKGERANGTAPAGSWSLVGRNAAGQLQVLANRANEEDAQELAGHRSTRTFRDLEVVANG